MRPRRTESATKRRKAATQIARPPSGFEHGQADDTWNAGKTQLADLRQAELASIASSTSRRIVEARLRFPASASPNEDAGWGVADTGRKTAAASVGDVTAPSSMAIPGERSGT